MPSISSLPNELVLFVIENLKSRQDVASLSQTNRRLHEAVSPVLYKNEVDRHNMWPLAFAAFSGRASTMRKMLAAGADPNWLFDTNNVPLQALALLSRSHDRVPQPPNAPFGRSQASEPSADLSHAAYYAEYAWSPASSDVYDADIDFDEELLGDQALDVWGILDGPNFPLDLNGSSTVSDEDDLDDGMLDDSSLSGDSSDDSSTFGYSDRPRDGAERKSNPWPRFFTSLHIASGMGNNEVVEVLLDHGALIGTGSRMFCGCKGAAGMLNNVESPEFESQVPLWTPLHIAICHNRPDTAMLLLSRGASCLMESLQGSDAAEGNGGSTALHQAAAFGQVDLVQYLVEKGHQTKIDVQDERTLTPFYYAYANSRWDSTIPLLLQMGAAINVEIKFYQPYCTITPLGEAVRLGNFEDAQKLIDLGADTSHGFVATGAGHRKGLSPLHLGCMPSALPRGRRKFFEEADKAGQRMKIMETFISKGSDIHGTDCYGDTALLSAAQNRVVPSLRALIAAGADVNATNSLGRTVVMQALLGPVNPLPGPVDHSDPRNGEELRAEEFRVASGIVRDLIEAGARIEDTDRDGNNILHLFYASPAGKACSLDATKFLLGCPGIDTLLSARNKAGQLAFEVAFKTPCELYICDALLRRGSVQNALKPDDLLRMWTFIEEKPYPGGQYLDMLLDLDSDRTLSSPALFSNVIARRAWSTVWLMARRGLPSVDEETCTMLLRPALRASRWDIAYQLIERGADVNAIAADEDNAPLTLVINRLDTTDYYRIERFVQILLDKGANIHYSPRGASNRPLGQAIDHSRGSLVQVMLRACPLRNDQRAVGGYYLHRALHFSPHKWLPHKGLPRRGLPQPGIVYTLIHSGADITELDEDGNYPMTVLLEGLCALAAVAPAQHFQFFPFFWCISLLNDLLGPGVHITQPNKQGLSVIDYLERLLQTKSGRSWTTPILELVEGEGGAKAISFKPDMALRRMPEHSPVTTIWDASLS